MPGRHNILLIVTDQERSWETLPSGLYLPARERLRAMGTYFRNYHANSVACSPSRSNIYTGRHFQKTLVFDNAGSRIRLDPAACPTLGHLLKAAGYFTAYAGKWHLSADEDLHESGGSYARALEAFGFDLFRPNAPDGDSYGRPQEGHRSDLPLARWARDWIAYAGSEVARSTPWFLAVNFINPHDVMFFDATGAQRRTQYRDWAAMTQAPVGPPYADDLGFELPPSFGCTARGRLEAHEAFARTAVLDYGEMATDDERAWRRYQNYYFNCLRDVDDAVAHLLDGLVASDELARTIVVFTSDHGEMGGAHTLRGKGPVIYRENFSVPLVVCHPDVATPSSSDALASAVDIVPTILDLAGARMGDESDGQLPGFSLARAVAESGGAGMGDRNEGVLLACSALHASNPDSARKRYDATSAAAHAGLPEPRPTWPRDHIDPGRRTFLRGLFDGRYRFGRYFRPDDHHLPADWHALTTRNDLELYDTATDPWEVTNLAAAPEADVALLLTLNEKLNRLLLREADGDDGAYLWGPKAPA